MKNLDYNLIQKYNNFHFFYSGYLSNWADTPFVDLSDGNSYNCSEQYMMYHKASLYGDHETSIKIMEARHPGDQKALGRKVKNFNPDQWNKVAKNIVYRGCFYKFTQNVEAYQYLLSTDGTLLVEASPTDVIWGIGLGGYDDLRHDPQNWRGSNWLGEVLTKLRENLMLNPYR
jgi:ribA/ribD-fused uncharacterized protein